LESADQVVIIEGMCARVVDPDPALVKRVEAIYQQKYNMAEAPVAVVTPLVAFAWTTYPTTVTRFNFAPE
jgi:hypothetical protein